MAASYVLAKCKLQTYKKTLGGQARQHIQSNQKWAVQAQKLIHTVCQCKDSITPVQTKEACASLSWSANTHSGGLADPQWSGQLWFPRFIPTILPLSPKPAIA